MFSHSDARPSVPRRSATGSHRVEYDNDHESTRAVAGPSKAGGAIPESPHVASPPDRQVAPSGAPVTPSPPRARHTGVSRTKSDGFLVSPAGWAPSNNNRAPPVARVESKTGRGTGAGTGTVKEELESGLSRGKSLLPQLWHIIDNAVYVQAERAPLDLRRASEDDRGKASRVGWGRGLVEGAYSAGVLGAALGLYVIPADHSNGTDVSRAAYRLIATGGKPSNAVHTAAEPPSEALAVSEMGVGPTTSSHKNHNRDQTPERALSGPPSPSPVTPAMNHRLPPPAYEDISYAMEEWTDEDEQPVSTHPLTPPRKYTSQRPPKTRICSDAELPAVPNTLPARKRPPKVQHARSRHSARSSLSRLSHTSEASFEIITPEHTSYLSRSSLPPWPASDRARSHVDAEEAEGPATLNERLDEMTTRLQQLISEGQAALLSSPPTPGHWVDDASE